MCFDDSEAEPQIIIKSWDREMIKPKLEKTNKNTEKFINGFFTFVCNN